MTYSKWSISATGAFLHNQKRLAHRPINIVHLDDHKIFVKGLKNFIFPFFPLAEIHNVTDGYQALSLMENNITRKSMIHLIITDINHPGLRGDAFLQQVRSHERKMKVPRTPAIVVSMVDADQMQHICAPGLSIVDYYFSKAIEVEDLIIAMEDILYADSNS